jgi:hypothetical protein
MVWPSLSRQESISSGGNWICRRCDFPETAPSVTNITVVNKITGLHQIAGQAVKLTIGKFWIYLPSFLSDKETTREIMTRESESEKFACNGIGVQFDCVILMECSADNGYQTESSRQ